MAVNIASVIDRVTLLLTTAGVRFYPFEAEQPAAPCVALRSVVARQDSTGSWAYDVTLDVATQRISDRAARVVCDQLIDQVAGALLADGAVTVEVGAADLVDDPAMHITPVTVTLYA